MDTLGIINAVLESVIGFAAIAGNAIVLAALHQKKSLHTVTNCIIASLAVADMLVGIGIPIVMLPLFGLPHEYYSCLFVNSLIVILTGVSMLHLLAVAVERFIAIKFPFWYHAHFTTRKAMAICLTIWVVALVLGLVPMMGWNNGWNEDNVCSFMGVMSLEQHVYFHFFGVMVTPLFIMLIIYIFIFVEVQKTARQIAALSIKNSSDGEAEDRKTSNSAEIKAAKRFTLVIVLFALSWFPLELQNCVLIWYGVANIVAISIAVWFTHLNSAINPFLYAYGNSVLRKAMKDVILCRDPNRSMEAAGSA